MKNLFLLIILSIACASCATTECKPVLFPFLEYAYEAEPHRLSGLFAPNKSNEIVEFYNLKVEVPENWRHEIPHTKTMLHLFSPDKNRSVLIIYESSRSFGLNSSKGMHLIGCDNFEAENDELKTSKDYIRDVFLFTEKKFDDPEFKPTFWNYFILWSKIDFLENAKKMVHYQGDNFEAFRLDSEVGKMDSRIYLFPKEFEQNYYTIIANFHDDDFLNNFVDMIDALN